MLIEDCLKEFIFECQIRKLSPRTIKSYKNNTALFGNYIVSEFEVTEVEEVNHQYIKKYFHYLISKGLSETYTNSILKSLRAFFKYCEQEDYIRKNPCEKVSWQREKKVLIKTFDDEEIKGMLNYYDFSNFMNARNKTILALLIDTGARNLEVCSIRNKDIKETYMVIRGKGNKERHVAISPYLKKHMIKYERIKEYYFKDKVLKDDNYFLSRTSRPLTVESLGRITKMAGDGANISDDIRCSPHTFRHYFAQTQLKNGLDVYSLSRLLGHENISITKRYLQSIRDEDVLQMSIKTSPLMNLK